MNRFNQNPRQLFLIDGIGALVSAVSLGVILPMFQSHIGVPLQSLYFLALWPVLFAVYDLYCYFSKSSYWKFGLRAVALLNISYTILSVYLLIQHQEQVKVLGWLYFIGEILILIVLSRIEWRASSSKM